MGAPSSGSASARRAPTTSGAAPSSGPCEGSGSTAEASGFDTDHRLLRETGAGEYSSSDQTQRAGLNENRTGSPCPMNGGGPVLANACTRLAAITTRNTTAAARSRGRSVRITPPASRSRTAISSAPIRTIAAQKMNRAQV